MQPLYLIILLFISSISFGQEHDFSTIDAHSKSAPKTYTTDVKKLSAYLCKEAKNDLEKIRAFYTWIGYNIEYDYTKYKVYKYTGLMYDAEQSPMGTLQRGKGVCRDIAQLFKALCEAVNIPALYVVGDVRGRNLLNIKKLQPHAWNVVKADGRWLHIDATWGLDKSGKLNYFYFDTPPHDFIKTHLPRYAHHQLLEEPVIRKGFLKEKYIKSDFTVYYHKKLEPGKLCDEQITFGKEEKEILLKEMETWTLNGEGNTGIYLLGYCNRKFKKIYKTGTIEEKKALIARYDDGFMYCSPNKKGKINPFGKYAKKQKKLKRSVGL